jgi:hypothetical protein
MTLDQVMRRIRWAYITMLFSAFGNLVMIIASMGGIWKSSFNLWQLTDSSFALLLALLIFLKSRTASVIAAIYFLACRIDLAIEMPKNIGVWLGFSLLYFLMEGVRATFVYHKIYKNVPFTVVSAYNPPWLLRKLHNIPLIYLLALPFLSLGTALTLLTLALVSYSNPLPMPRALYIFVGGIASLSVGIAMVLRSELMRELLLAAMSLLAVVSLCGMIGSPFYEERHIAYTGFGISLVLFSLSLLLLRLLSSREVVDKTNVSYRQNEPIEYESP